VFFTGSVVVAQQSPVYSQYTTNGFIVNPALAGADGTLKFSLSAHDYFVGIKNTPMTITAGANGRLLKRRTQVVNGKLNSQSGRVGMGGLIFNDRNGLINRIGFQYTYAYHIDLRTSQLSLGLSASVSQTRIDAKRLDFNDPEPLLKEGFGNLAYVPDAVLGVVYRKGEYYLGLTASNLFQRSINFGEFDYDYVMYRHYYLLGGTTYNIGRNASLSPSFLAKMTSNHVYQAEIGTRFAYKDDAWIAVSYRTPNIAALMVGVRAGKIYIGYAYEYYFGSIRQLSKGNQEINLIYRIGDPTRRYRFQTRY
jgi:type IX secretion system PorP/SprF family membrane protein